MSHPEPLAICMKPLPLSDPELSHLTEGQVAANIHRLWREYDWHESRKTRQEIVQQLRRGVTDDHPVLREWAILEPADTHQYWRHVRNPRKRQAWEKRFREAKTTTGRHWALTNLWKYTTDFHPMVQLYLNRHQHKPSSRQGWWELEPAKKAKTKPRLVSLTLKTI